YLFAACAYSTAPDPGVYRNVDAAGTGQWQQVFTDPNMGRTVLAVARSNQSVVYAMSSSMEPGDARDALLGVYRSAANGDPDSWETRATRTDSNRVNTTLLSNPRDVFLDT